MKKHFALAALLALSACSKSPEELFADAQAAYAEHDYRAARIHIAAALKDDPGNRDMLQLQARSALALGDGEGARAALEPLLAAQPDSIPLHEMLAESAFLRKKPDQVREALTGIETAESERLRALAALQEQDVATAGRHFAKAVEIGGNGRAFADYAKFRLQQGDVAGAQDMLAQAEQVDPDEIDTLLIGAQIATQKGQLAEALTYYERATKAYPANLAALTGQAAVLGDLGRLDEMKAITQRAAKSAPQDARVAYLSARAAYLAEDWEQVRKIAQPLESRLDDMPALQALYAEALLNLEQPQQAAAQAMPVARKEPGNRAVLVLLAKAQLASGEAASALATMKPVAESPQVRPEELALMAQIAKAAKDPSAERYAQLAANPSPRSLAADLAEADEAIKQANWQRAVIAYDRVLAVTDGKNPLVLNNMAYAKSMLGNGDEAIAFADRALKELPGNASVMDTAGWVRFRAGKELEKARRLIRDAAEKAPANATIQAHLAELDRSAS